MNSLNQDANKNPSMFESKKQQSLIGSSTQVNSHESTTQNKPAVVNMDQLQTSRDHESGHMDIKKEEIYATPETGNFNLNLSQGLNSTDNISNKYKGNENQNNPTTKIKCDDELVTYGVRKMDNNSITSSSQSNSNGFSQIVRHFKNHN